MRSRCSPAERIGGAGVEPSDVVVAMWLSTYMLVGMSKWSTLAELDHPGDAIRERRIALGWTQAELAELSGVSQADISRMENHLLDARWSTIRRLSLALASEQRPPKRSLANGRIVAEAPRPTKRWKPSGPSIEVDEGA